MSEVYLSKSLQRNMSAIRVTKRIISKLTRTYFLNIHPLHSETRVYRSILAFSKQAFNESSDFCKLYNLMNHITYDRQLPCSLVRTMRFEHRIHSLAVTLVLRLTASHI